MPDNGQDQQHLLQEDTPVPDGTAFTFQGHAKDPHDKSERRLNLSEKLTLVAELLGIQASVSYERLYQLPVLQTLGMPLRLVPIIGFVSGVIGVVVVPILGWLSDKGPNPNRRKRNGVLASASLMLLGVAVVIVASFLHLQPPDVFSKLGDNSSFLGNTSTSLPMEASFGKSTVNVSDFTALSNPRQSFGKAEVSITQTYMNISEENGINREVPVTASFAMLGFIVFELGYDNVGSVTRAWILACSPRGEHTSLLVLGLVMAAVGGISTAALARVDFPSLLNMLPTNSDSLLRLIVQISIQGAIAAAFLVLGMVSTLLSGSRLSTRLQSREDCLYVPADKNANSSSDVKLQRLNGDKQDSIETADEKGLTESYGMSRKLDESVPQHTDELPAKISNNRELEQLHQMRARCPARQFVCKIFFICSGMCFTCGTSHMFTYFISDYVGKAVYGGDPRADADSDDLENYLTGVRTAAWGILVYMVTYLLINFVHTRILAVIGHKVEFVLVQLVTGGSMVLLAVTARLELFFLLCVVAGLHRACLYVVPYAATNEIIHEEAEDKKSGRQRVGMAMSIVTAMIPLAFCILYPWTGVLTEWTGVVSTPLWVGATFSCLAAVSFLFV